MNPYIDNGTARVFDSNVEPDQLVWHRDEEDRTITVLEGDGWQFQFDNQLPFDINVGDVFTIPAMVYHRILKGQNQLLINIERTLPV